MATELLATTATGGSISSDITAIAGTPVTLFLKSATSESLPADAKAVIEIKSSGGQYYYVGELTASSSAKVIDGAGTYRVIKTAGYAYGVDQG